MSKPEQLLLIEPKVLVFKEPYHTSTTYMKLTNPTADKIFFKIKTTAPKKYCVRPNSGSLEAREECEVAITPQPQSFDPSDKHKFMVQAAVAPDAAASSDTVWREVGPDRLMESKLKCVFESARPPGAEEPPAQRAELRKAFAAPEAAKSSTPLKDNYQHAESANASGEHVGKMSEEVARLLESERKLKHEIMLLKEEQLHLRARQSDTRTQTQGHTYAPPDKAERMPTGLLVAIAVAVGILGIVIGKFIM